MRRICAWCKKEMAPADDVTDDGLISHGICEECKKLVIAGMAGGQRSEARDRIDINKEIKDD